MVAALTIAGDTERNCMTRYELRTIASHHRSWLKAQREGISRGANLRGDFSETMRNLGRFSPIRGPRSEHPISGSR